MRAGEYGSHWVYDLDPLVSSAGVARSSMSSRRASRSVTSRPRSPSARASSAPLMPSVQTAARVGTAPGSAPPPTTSAGGASAPGGSEASRRALGSSSTTIASSSTTGGTARASHAGARRPGTPRCRRTRAGASPGAPVAPVGADAEDAGGGHPVDDRGPQRRERLVVHGARGERLRPQGVEREHGRRGGAPTAGRAAVTLLDRLLWRLNASGEWLRQLGSRLRSLTSGRGNFEYAA
jgi:hypothetical protein